MSKHLVLTVLVAVTACATDPVGPSEDKRTQAARAYCLYLERCHPEAVAVYGNPVACIQAVSANLDEPTDAANDTDACVADFNASTCSATGFGIPSSCGWFGFYHSCAAVCPSTPWFPHVGDDGYEYSTCGSGDARCYDPGTK